MDKNKVYEYMTTIVDTKSISLASERLFVSQPSLSQFIARLECKLGVKLFDRSKSPLELTYAGECYMEHLNQIYELEKKLMDELEDIKTNRSEKLTIGVHTQRGTIILPAILSEFQKVLPLAKVDFIEGSSTYLESMMLKDKLDCSLLNLTSYNMKFTYEHIMYEKILFVANKDNPLVKYLNTSFEEPYNIDITAFKNEKFVTVYPELNLYHISMNLLGKYNITPNVVFQTLNIMTAINLVASNSSYFTFAPETFVKHAEHNEQLKVFTVDNPELTWSFDIVYKNNKYMSHTLNSFIKCVKDHKEMF